jgi:hypothetical protein
VLEETHGFLKEDPRRRISFGSIPRRLVTSWMVAVEYSKMPNRPSVRFQPH